VVVLGYVAIKRYIHEPKLVWPVELPKYNKLLSLVVYLRFKKNEMDENNVNEDDKMRMIKCG